jgi:RNA polymerase sigma factor (TIGR02999 family)
MMAKPHPNQVTALLEGARLGKQEAIDQLIAAVYPELRGIAGRYLRAERPHHTLQPTALVHETYARLFGSKRRNWKSRAHFFAAIAKEMRRILVDYARARNAQKGPGKRVMVSLDVMSELGAQPAKELVALDEALSRLEELEPRASRVVELRFFTGLDERETAEALAVSVSTVKRDWQFARAWLFNELGSPSARAK